MSRVKEKDKKHGDQSAAHINLKVKCQDGNEVFFRIKRSTRLKKLMNSFCRAQSVEKNSVTFLFEGRRLHAKQTPDELEMKDGDVINSMPHQTGVLVSKLESTTFSGILCAIETLKSERNDLDRRISDLEAQLLSLKTLKTHNDMVVKFWNSKLRSVFAKLKTTLSRLVYAPNLDYLLTMSTSQSQLSKSEIESQMSGVTNQEEDDQSAANIFLNIISMHGTKVVIYMARRDQLKILMNAYANRMSVETSSIAFLFDGRLLRPEQTPNELEMEDGNEIHAILHQTG